MKYNTLKKQKITDKAKSGSGSVPDKKSSGMQYSWSNILDKLILYQTRMTHIFSRRITLTLTWAMIFWFKYWRPIWWWKCKLKVGDSPSIKICVMCLTESPLKMMKNAFYFILKALLVLKILKIFSSLFCYVGKTAWLEG